MASQNVFGFVSVIETLGRAQTCSSMPWWFRNPCCSAGCAASNQSIANVHINYYIIKGLKPTLGWKSETSTAQFLFANRPKKTFSKTTELLRKDIFKQPQKTHWKLQRCGLDNLSRQPKVISTSAERVLGKHI